MELPSRGDISGGGKRMIRVLYVDDEGDARRDLRELLIAADISVDTMPPPPGLDLPGNAQAYDVYLVDYELTKPEPDGTKANYRGGALGFSILETAVDRPVLLITREGYIKKHELQLLEDLPVFDTAMYKGKIEANPEYGQRSIRRFADGFDVLRRQHRDWRGLMTAVGKPDSASELDLRTVAPPISDSQWSVSGMARWLERVLFMYPGPLYDSLHAAVMLGLDPSALQDTNVASVLEPARYVGALAPDDGRWWRATTIRIATHVALEQGFSGPLRTAFPAAMEARSGATLARATCVHCNEAGADAVCYIFRAPVRSDHSFAYTPDQRPAAMEGARVSFKAVVETNDVKEESLDPNATGLVARLRAAAQNASD